MLRKHHRAVAVSSVSVSILLGIIFTEHVYAAHQLVSTNIQTVVCGSDSMPSVVIESPIGDTTISNNTFLIKGSAEHVTQVDITIDGVYDHSVPISLSDSSFETRSTALKGTHTVTAEAYGYCNDEKTQTSVVITVAPGSAKGAIETLQPTNMLKYQQDLYTPTGKRHYITPREAVDVVVQEANVTARRLAPPILLITSTVSLILGLIGTSVRQTVFHIKNIKSYYFIIPGVIGIFTALIFGS